MPQLDEIVGSTTGVRITDDDYDYAEKVGYEKKPPSTVLTKALKDSSQLKDIRDRKKEDLENRLLEMKKEAKIYDIELSELI